MGTPPKIIRPIIVAIAIDVVNIWLMLRVWNECFCNKTMNHVLVALSIKPEFYSLVTILVLLVLHYLYFVIAVHVMKGFDSSKARYLVPAFIADHGFPNLFFHISQILKSHIKKGRRAVRRLLSMGSYSHLSAMTKILNSLI